MPKTAKPNPTEARKRGGQPKPAAEKARMVNTTVPAVVHDHLALLGGGSASRGARIANCESYRRALRMTARKK